MKKRSLILIIVIMIMFSGISVFAKEVDLNILASTASTSCTGYFGDVNTEGTLMYTLHHNIFVPIRWIIPILFVIFTTIDFSKVVFTDSKDGMDKAKKNFTKRAIMVIVIFFIPTILEILFEFVDNQAIKSCISKF